MNRDQLRDLMHLLQSGDAEVDEIMERLRVLPFEDIGFAKIDHHRTFRRGFPEAVFCTGKSVEQVIGISERLLEGQGQAVITKVPPDLQSRLEEHFGDNIEFVPGAGMAFLGSPSLKIDGSVAVVTAGTSDIPIAEEAASICERFGAKVSRIFDVGIAGLHRIMPHIDTINGSDAVIVVAGMEGALPSMVSSLTDRPVIAVPTAIGYGASFRGLAALLGMLCSCSPGIAVVNIDNGFGAGVFALSVLRVKSSEK